MKSMTLLFLGSLLLSVPSEATLAAGIMPPPRKVGEQTTQSRPQPDLSDVSPRGFRAPSPSQLEISFHPVQVKGKKKYHIDHVDPNGPFAKKYHPGQIVDEMPTLSVKTRSLAADAKSDPENSKHGPSH